MVVDGEARRQIAALRRRFLIAVAVLAALYVGVLLVVVLA